MMNVASETVPAAPKSESDALLDTLRAPLRALASLKLTVALFAMSLILVFFGTLAQKNAGIWTVVDQYFWSWIVMIDTELFFQFLQIFFGLPANVSFSLPIPFPGGKLLGGLMFVNLIAAHATRFKLTWRRSGIFILHGGILLMFLGEFITREFTVEQQMRITEGGSANYTIDTRNYELAVIDPSGAEKERVVAVPASMLQRRVNGAVIELPEVPLDLKVLSYYANSELFDRDAPESAKAAGPQATAGIGKILAAVERPTVSGVETDKKGDSPAATIEFRERGGASLGTWLFPLTSRTQEVTVAGKKYLVLLRSTLYYKPFTLHLNKFSFDRYLGTNTPKNYSSDVILKDPERGVEQTVRIAMNEPLRYRGETFYQSSFTPDESTTILSVVDNPGWIIPYVSCGVVTFGLLLHFGIHLREYLRRMLAVPRTTVTLTKLERWLPWGILAFTVAMIALAAMPHGKPGRKGLDLNRLARIPVVDGGRVKPLDTVARIDLRQINHKEFYTRSDEPGSRPAIDWWLDAASTDDPKTSTNFQAEVFRIESDQVLNLLGLPRRDGLRYSAADIGRKYDQLQPAAFKANAKPEKQRDLFDAKVLELWKKLGTHDSILRGEGLTIPPMNGQVWRTQADAKDRAYRTVLPAYNAETGKEWTPAELQKILQDGPPKDAEKLRNDLERLYLKSVAADPGYSAWRALYRAYRAGDQAKLNEAVDSLEALATAGISGGDMARVRFEAILNDLALAFWCIGLYVLAFLLVAGAWVCYGFNPGLGEALRRSAVLVLLFTFTLHTITLLGRMYLMDRPLVFVTNLYSTAVFIGWAAVGACLIVERLIPITLGLLVASALGFLTSILAHNVLTSGDTLEMMQAVLDTNFWLATHVTTINLGYSATYMAGLIAIAYLVLGLGTPHLRRSVTLGGKPQELGRVIGQVLYGVIAAATVLSFVGTVLGGIWGDQSWGRFWGWDPKENGALMIVIWNTLILHARWAGLVKDRGIAVLALGGNMITTWSYFGTNQLGVGLHAYGFNNTLAMLCVVMWIVNLVLIGIGCIPKKYWRSYQQG